MQIERIDPAAHLEELVALARVEYGESEIANANYLRWQYLDNPAGKAVVVAARAYSGELAGQYVVIPLQFKLDGNVVNGSLSLNTLTHPDYRGQGLFTKMANETYAICEQEGLSLTLGFPNKNSYPGFVRKLRFRHIGNATVMFRPLRPLSLLASVTRLKNALKYAPSALHHRDSELSSWTAGSFEIRPLDFYEDAAEYDQMIAAQSESGPRFSVQKCAKFLHWRLQRIPTREYRAFQALDATGTQATCAIRRRKVKGIECAFVVDLQLADGQKGLAAGRSLLKTVLRYYRSTGAALAGMMVNAGSRSHHLARSVWFREMPHHLLPHDAPIIVRRNGNAASTSVYDIKAWDFSFSDYDVF